MRGTEVSKKLSLPLKGKRWRHEFKIFIFSGWGSDQQPAHETLRPGEIFSLNAWIAFDGHNKIRACRRTYSDDRDGLCTCVGDPARCTEEDQCRNDRPETDI